jgi:two-component system sensor histidine kinase RegB
MPIPGPPEARLLDERTLQQALINLLNNAADASRERLALHARWDRDALQIEILDRGPGVRPDTSKPLLRPLETDKAHGLGLGLFLTHAALQRLGGEVVLSDRDGGGTCTRVRLPLTRMDDGRRPEG